MVPVAFTPAVLLGINARAPEIIEEYMVPVAFTPAALWRGRWQST